jgi:hypothetical protein
MVVVFGDSGRLGRGWGSSARLREVVQWLWRWWHMVERIVVVYV